MAKKSRKGWHHEPYRHSLARRGIKTVDPNKKMSKEEFDHWATKYLDERAEYDAKKFGVKPGETIKHTIRTPIKESKVLQTKPGHRAEHIEAARALAAALNAEKGSGQYQRVHNVEAGLEGPDSWDTKPIGKTNIRIIYLKQLRDILNQGLDEYKEGKISEKELDRREFIITEAANYISDSENKRYLKEDDLTDFMRRAFDALNGKNELVFFYDIGKEWVEPDTYYKYD